MQAEDIIRLLELKPLPFEGGYYREIYRSSRIIPEKALFGKHEGDRNYSTAIYFLITPENFSALHILPQDEVFHFYQGDPVELIQIDSKGRLIQTTLGSKIESGEHHQWVVPGGTWQGARLVEGGQWALMGTTVAPGFDHRDFQLGDRKTLLKKFPQHRREILVLTKSESDPD